MSYSKFTLEKVVETFDLKISYIEKIISDPIISYPVSDFLKETFRRNRTKAFLINTEKARSELLVAPILVELQEIKNNEITFFSGITFNVDKNKGLAGACDFLISLDRNQGFLTAPLISVVEAKNDNVNNGLGQCIAEMVAAQIFNANKGRDIKIIYGLVTNGLNWKLLKLIDNQVL
jgi:tetrahydromethanopterin S-methyltransferase subunit G